MIANQLRVLEGRTCVGANRIVHQMRGESPTPGSALELIWKNGDVSLLDDNNDLTLSVSQGEWRDPYADVDKQNLTELAEEVGLWSRVPVDDNDPLGGIVGARVRGVDAIFNRVSQLSGVRIFFTQCVLSAEVMTEGLLKLEISPIDPSTWPLDSE